MRRLLSTLILPAALFAAACAPHKSGPVRVVYWEKWTGREADAMRAVVDAFNASQDRIAVDLLSVSQVDRKTIIATAGGDPPDIAGIWLHNIASFAERGALTPLDAFLRADGIDTDQWLERYEPVYADICRHNGVVWCLPTTPSATALHWNKQCFRDAGLDPERPPRTVEELDAFSDRITRKDPATGRLTRVGFLPQEPGWWNWAFPVWFGGSIWDGLRPTVATDPRNLAAYRWVSGYSQRYGIESIKSFTSGFGTFGSPQSAFFTGKVAMVFQGVWLNQYINRFAPGLDYGVAPWPAAPGGPDLFTVAGADVLAIPRGARHPREAWAFIRYASEHNPEARSRADLRGMELLCYLQEKNSPLRHWSPFFADHHPHPHVALFRKLAASPNAVHEPSTGVWQEYSRELSIAFDKVRLLQAGPEEALHYCQQRVAARARQHQASLARRQSPRGHGDAPQ